MFFSGEEGERTDGVFVIGILVVYWIRVWPMGHVFFLGGKMSTTKID